MKNKHLGSSLRSLFVELGEEQELHLLTLKKVIADELRHRMARTGVTQAKLAAAMKTSRTITHRLLDPTDTGVTLDTLVRASDALGLDLDLSFRVRKVAQRRTG
jgi:antitoxin HicB